jgi:hypothetical protein
MSKPLVDAIETLGSRLSNVEDDVHGLCKGQQYVAGAVEDLGTKVSRVAIDQAEQMDSVIDTLERICSALNIRSTAKRLNGRRDDQGPQAGTDATAPEPV